MARQNFFNDNNVSEILFKFIEWSIPLYSQNNSKLYKYSLLLIEEAVGERVKYQGITNI